MVRYTGRVKPRLTEHPAAARSGDALLAHHDALIERYLGSERPRRRRQ
jgi:hypothetical protein